MNQSTLRALVKTHLSDPSVAAADWQGVWPMVDDGGVITDVVDSDDIEVLNLVPVYIWAGRLVRDDSGEAFAFALSDAVVEGTA